MMAYGSVALTLDNVLLPKEKLTPTPSFQDGLDEETEKDLRITGCELIQSSGILLKLPQTAMATGQVLFQRFYYSKSFVRQAMEATAMACVYLASKIEEAPRRIRDVINVFHHLRQYRSKKSIQPLILDPAYIRLKSDVTLAERRILKELGFCVHVKHPHKLIVIYMQQLGYGQEKEFMQMAWNYMNDALRTNVFVIHTPEAIACACVFLTGRMLNVSLPQSWFQVFDITEAELIQIATQIIDLYNRPKVNFDELENKVLQLTKTYQESRQKSRTVENVTPEVADRVKSDATNSETKTSAIQDVKPPEIEEKKAIPAKTDEVPRGKELRGEVNGNFKKKRDSSNTPPRKARHLDSNSPSPNRKRRRRSPSPIVYSESPSRHKHRKHKKISSSRSRSYERKNYKKVYSRRDRSQTPDSIGRHEHHKRKYRR